MDAPPAQPIVWQLFHRAAETKGKVEFESNLQESATRKEAIDGAAKQTAGYLMHEWFLICDST